MNLEYLLKSILNYNFYLIEKKLLLIVKMIYILQNSDFNVTCREFIPLYSVTFLCKALSGLKGNNKKFVCKWKVVYVFVFLSYVGVIIHLHRMCS